MLAAAYASEQTLYAASAVCLAAVTLAVWARGDIGLPTVLTVGILLRVLAWPMGPTLSDDLWRYLFDGVVVTGGVNPYLFVPADPAVAFAADVVPVQTLNSPGFFSVYPPLSQTAFAVAGFLARTDLYAGVCVLKTGAFASELVALLLLARMVPPRALVLYAWNPVVITEAAGQGHTEAFLLPLVVGAVVAFRHGRGTPACALVAAGALVKIWPVLLLPFAWRRAGWRGVIVSLVVLAAGVLPFYHPHAAGNVWRSLSLYATYFDFNAGVFLFLRDVVGVPNPPLGTVLRIALLAGVAAAFAWDIKRHASFDAMCVVVIGVLLLTSTTVHPWYLLPLLCLPAVLEKPVWPVLWLAAVAPLTYLRYGPGETAYLVAVAVGWGGYAALADVPALLTWVLWRRAKSKARRVAPHIPPASRVLDLGCGEGFVGGYLADLGHDVTLCDVADFRRVALPMTRYDGRRLPFENGAFDAVVLYFVLHHAVDAPATLAEAARVARRVVVVVESVYRTDRERRILTVLDRLANRLRAGHIMAAQEEHVCFRTADAWRETAEGFGLNVTVLDEFGRPPHRQALLVLEPS